MDQPDWPVSYATDHFLISLQEDIQWKEAYTPATSTQTRAQQA
jgi:hypothetical protein